MASTKVNLYGDPDGGIASGPMPVIPDVKVVPMPSTAVEPVTSDNMPVV